MNDFTKEELQYILYACERSPLEDGVVENKIQSMIDNYCEHSSSHISDGVTYTITEGSPKGVFRYYKKKCQKCGEFYK